MKTSGYLFPTNKIGIFSIAMLGALCLIQCKQEILPGFSADDLSERLKKPDYSFFDGIKEDSLPGSAIFSLSPGAGYFLGLAAGDYGRADLAAHFFLLEWEKASAPYDQLASAELCGLYNKAEDYEKIAPLADAFLEKYPDSPIKDKVKFEKIRALYWQKNDEQVLALIAADFGQTGAELAQNNPELLLFKVVASTRLQKPGWQALVREFFFTIRFASFHKRLHTWLVSEKEILAQFSPFEQDLFEAKGLLGNGEYGNAIKKYEQLFPLIPAGWFPKSTHINDFTAASMGGGPTPGHAAVLAARAGSFGPADQLAAYDAAGRIFFSVKDYASARSCNDFVLARSDDPLQKKRMIWRLCKISLAADTQTAGAVFLNYAPRWDDPAYYSDLVDELVNLLVEKRDFTTLVSLQAKLSPTLVNSQKAQFSYIAARALMLNYVASVSNAKKEETIQGLLRQTVAEEQWGYYALLSACLLKEENLYKKTAGVAARDPKELLPDERLIEGYIIFGLYDRALSLIFRNKSDLSNETLSFLAEKCAGRDHPYEAIQILGILRERGISLFAERDYNNFYPRAFSPLIVKYASDYGINENLFFALIRQESAFNAAINSRAGAVGLSQLMPDTGEWVAGQLKIEKADLTDPGTNLMFGGYYLSFLRKRLETVPLILAGYNAGPTNARKWKQLSGDLPPDLAVEAIPFAETRSFIKNIFFNHALYTMLYKNGSPRESAKLFYNF